MDEIVKSSKRKKGEPGGSSFFKNLKRCGVGDGLYGHGLGFAHAFQKPQVFLFRHNGRVIVNDLASQSGVILEQTVGEKRKAFGWRYVILVRIGHPVLISMALACISRSVKLQHGHNARQVAVIGSAAQLVLGRHNYRRQTQLWRRHAPR